MSVCHSIHCHSYIEVCWLGYPKQLCNWMEVFGGLLGMEFCEKNSLNSLKFSLTRENDSKAGVFYKVKNRSSIVTSKNLSENLSNHNKHLCFCCLQDKT